MNDGGILEQHKRKLAQNYNGEVGPIFVMWEAFDVSSLSWCRLKFAEVDR